MPKFDVAVTWSCAGTYRGVEAATLEEAIEKVLDADVPYENLPNGEYIDESILIDHDRTQELNEET